MEIDESDRRPSAQDPEARFGWADVLLVPTALAGYLILLSLGPFAGRPVRCLIVDIFALFALRLAAGLYSGLTNPGSAFTLAPLAVLSILQRSPAELFVIAGLLWIVLTPLIVAMLGRVVVLDRLLRNLAAFAVYPLFVIAYPLAVVGIDSPPHLDFFEDGHELLPASEMLAGRLPYADTVPVHGLLSDGGFELALMSTGDRALGDLLLARRVAHCVTFAAVYTLAWVATDLAEAGLLAALLSVFLVPGWPLGLRPPLALFALAAAVAASRLGSRRWMAAAGAILPLAFLASPEFALYSGLVAIAAAVVMPERGRALLALAGGAGTVQAAILGVFAWLGFAGPFLRTTLSELPAAGPAYVLGRPVAPTCLATLTTLRLQVGPLCLEACLWVVILIATAAAIATRSTQNVSRSPLWLIGGWIALAGISYAERQHLYAGYAVTAFLVSALVLLTRRQGWRVTLLLSVLVLWLANPLGHLFEVASPPRLNVGHEIADAVPGPVVPRARGALIDPTLRGPIEVVRRFTETRLGPGETWIDFTNSATLYFLFDRRCPARYPEIPFLESAQLQTQLIATLERDRTVRAALVAFPNWSAAIDGVPNSVRAPLVWAYLKTHFSPVVAESGVVFWMRR